MANEHATLESDMHVPSAKTVSDNESINQSGVGGHDEHTVEMTDLKNDSCDTETKDKSAIKPVGFFQLFRYASGLDIILILIATFASVAQGATFPLSLFYLGATIDSLIALGSSSNSTELSAIEGEITQFSFIYVYIALGVLLVAFVQNALWKLTAERQIHTIKLHFFHSILHQDIAWYDVQNSGDLANRFSDDIAQIQSGIGDKVGTIIQHSAQCLGGLIMGFVMSWKVALVILSFVVLIIFPITTVMAKLTQRMSQRVQDDYGKAGSMAEEVLSCIRTVVVFGGQHRESEK